MAYCKIHFSAVYGVSGFAVEICGLICCNPTPNNYPCASIFSIVRQCKSPWYLFRFCSSTADAQISLIWCFLLDALQFMIRMVERAYLDWNYPFVHRCSPSPWRELPCQCQLQTWGRRHAGCSRQQLYGRADLIRIKLPIFMPFFMRMRMRYPRGERAATAQQLTGTPGSNRAVTVNLQRQHRKRTETASQTRRNRAATGAIYSCSYLYVSRPNIQPHTCTYALTWINPYVYVCACMYTTYRQICTWYSP